MPTKGIVVTGAGSALDLHGRETARTWTWLAHSARPGDSVIFLQHPLGGARAGDEIVLTTSRHRDYFEDTHGNEVATVLEVRSGGTELRLTRVLSEMHWAGREYQAEVGLLTRNVVIEGGAVPGALLDGDDPEDERFGAHTMAGFDAVLRADGV